MSGSFPSVARETLEEMEGDGEEVVEEEDIEGGGKAPVPDLEGEGS